MRWQPPQHHLALGMATATCVRSCPAPPCRSAGRRVHTWRTVHPNRVPGRHTPRVVPHASPAGNHVLTSADGDFDVTYGTSDQLRDISDTQALAFFEPVTPVLDPLFLQYFKADVSVTLDRKYEYLDSRRFAPLVAAERRNNEKMRGKENDETWLDPLLGRWPGSKPSTNSGSNTATATPPVRSAKKEKKSVTTSIPIVGVVELSIQRDADVTDKLEFLMNENEGVSGAMTPWVDGAGPGGDMEKWANKRSITNNLKQRLGRWKGGAPCDEYAYISCMCVKDDYRRRGVADALLKAAEIVTLEWGYDACVLHVFTKNSGAIALYQSRGYQVIDDSCSAVDSLLGKQRFLMVKKLR